jgi:glycosyltransferase involved in cell wall biosynthesis
MSVSGIITAKNEAPTIAEVIRAARPFVDELIVVDGGSEDGTAEIAAGLGARVVQDRRRGKGDATRAGIEASRGEVLLIMTADAQDELARIPDLLAPISTGAADMVVGSRFLGGSEEFSATPTQMIRTMGNISLSVLINLRWKTDLSDVLNGFRAIKRELAVALALSSDSAAVEVEMVVKALRKGRRVINVPTHEFSRRHGATRLDVWKEGVRIYLCLFRNLGP